MPLLGNLEAAGYRRSGDIEINCPAERVDEEFGQRLANLVSLGEGRNGAPA